MSDNVILTVLPHSSFGDPSCEGCLDGVVHGDQAQIVCHECAAVVFTVPASDLLRTLDEIERTLDIGPKYSLFAAGSH